MMICPSCRAENDSGADRCTRCGTWFTSEEEPVRAQDRAPISDPLEEEVVHLLEQKKKIEAIKLYRQEKGGDLMTAKQAVDAIQAKHGLPAGTGCAGALLLPLALAVGYWIIA